MSKEAWMTKNEEYTTETIMVGNVTVYVHRPVLTDKERAKRTEELVSALARYGKAIIKN
jgi:hypothetical protein